MMRALARWSVRSRTGRRRFLVIPALLAVLGTTYMGFAPPSDHQTAGDDELSRLMQPTGPPQAAIDVTPASAVRTLPEAEAASETAAAPADLLADGPLEGRDALLLDMRLLEDGIARLERISDYTAVFYKQERIGGQLGPGQVMDMKLRHRPFSVYLKWTSGGDTGREVLYVEGENEGNLLVRAGGLRGRLLPALKLDPEGSMALSESRHPVTNIGMLNLARKMVEYRRRDLKRTSEVRCRIEEHVWNDRPCYRMELECDSPDVSATYRKSVHYIDRDLLLPVYVRNWGWPEGKVAAGELDEATLIEHYAYSNVRLNRQLADADFDRTNGEYRFRR